MAKISAYKAHETRMWIKDIGIPENREGMKELYEGATMKVKESKLYKTVFHK